MADKLSVITSTKDGQISRNRKLIQQIIKSFEGKTYEIIFQKVFKKRSNPQNAFYWGVIIPMVRDGMRDVGIIATEEKISDFLCEKFLWYEQAHNETGEMIKFSRSTSELSTSGMNEYWLEIKEWAFEFLGISIPDPDPEYKLNFEDRDGE